MATEGDGDVNHLSTDERAAPLSLEGGVAATNLACTAPPETAAGSESVPSEELLPDQTAHSSNGLASADVPRPTEALPRPGIRQPATTPPESAAFVPESGQGSRSDERAGAIVLEGFTAPPRWGQSGAAPHRITPSPEGASDLTEHERRVREHLFANVAEGVAMPAAEADEESSRDTKEGATEHRRWQRWAIAASVAATVVIVTATTGALVGRQPAHANAHSERFVALRAALEPVAGSAAFENSTSPQHRALLWLADEDERRIGWEDIADVTQRFVLATLFFATGGKESWLDDYNFLSPEHECAWNGEAAEAFYDGTASKGVICYGNLSTVTGLYLHTNNLVGTLPDELGHLPLLVVLSLSDNNLKGHLPPTLGRMEHIIILDLNQNNFTGAIPAAWGGMGNLKICWASKNRLTGTLPATLGNMTELLSFKMDFNDLSGHLPSSMTSLRNLAHLDLSRNRLSGSIPSSLGSLTSLTDLSLLLNDITGPIPESIGNLQNLKSIYLSDNFLTGHIPSSMNLLHNLVYLDIEDNLLEGTLPFWPDSLPHLQRLIAGVNNLTGTIPTAITTYRNLTQLWLDQTNVTGNLPSQIGNLKHLQELYLLDSDISGTIPLSLYSLKHLIALVLRKNRFSGTLHDDIGKMKNLEVINVAKNSLSGTLPETIDNLSRLFRFWVESNLFTGTVPRGILALQALIDVSLESNSFTGDISSLCSSKEMTYYSADCLGDDPEVICPCCSACCSDETYPSGPMWGCFSN